MGLLIAIVIIVLWTSHLAYSLTKGTEDFSSPLLYLHMIVQAYLYTGLFITAHDAMHGTVTKNKRVNRATGILALFLFAGMNYNMIIKSHMLHHKFPGEADDPDFNMPSQNFFIWWLKFMWGYLTIVQLVIMALIYNVLNIWFSRELLLVYWIIPAFLSTLQLFYFGTYQPHRFPHQEEMKPHNARSQRRNHVWAMLSCYFFGYHNEHHEFPRTPWWKLYRIKQ